MIKGYLGTVCFNGSVLKNHIIYLNSNGKISEISPFRAETEGIVLCDNVLLIIKSSDKVTPCDIQLLKQAYNSADSYENFFCSPTYIRYGAKSIDDSQFIEIGEPKVYVNKGDVAAIKDSKSYKTVTLLAKYMDKYYLDPILGLVPILGDIVSPICSIPSIYMALAKIKSIPLLIAIIFNILFDAVMGMIPLFIGNIFDFYNKSYSKNLKLIIGFIDNDKRVIREVNRKSIIFSLLIVAFIVIGVYMVKLAIYMVSDIIDFFSF